MAVPIVMVSGSGAVVRNALDCFAVLAMTKKGLP